nr:alpha/beta hydrolase [Dyella sp. OK004]
MDLIATTQGAVWGANFEEKVTVAAWSGKPSWYIVANNDRVIHPDAQRTLAKKLKANTTTLSTGYVPMVSRPSQVADVIAEAASMAPQSLTATSNGPTSASSCGFNWVKKRTQWPSRPVGRRPI